MSSVEDRRTCPTSFFEEVGISLGEEYYKKAISLGRTMLLKRVYAPSASSGLEFCHVS
jgi:hypothetical protein